MSSTRTNKSPSPDFVPSPVPPYSPALSSYQHETMMKFIKHSTDELDYGTYLHLLDLALNRPQTLRHNGKSRLDALYTRQPHLRYFHAMLVEEITPNVPRTTDTEVGSILGSDIMDPDIYKIYEEFIAQREESIEWVRDADFTKQMLRELVAKEKFHFQVEVCFAEEAEIKAAEEQELRELEHARMIEEGPDDVAIREGVDEMGIDAKDCDSMQLD